MRLPHRAGRDCATRERRVYEAPRSLRAQDGACLPQGEVEHAEFSLLSASAKDHVRVRLGSAVELSFIVGERELIVAYGKLGEQAPAVLIERVEALLAEYFELSI